MPDMFLYSGKMALIINRNWKKRSPNELEKNITLIFYIFNLFSADLLLIATGRLQNALNSLKREILLGVICPNVDQPLL